MPTRLTPVPAGRPTFLDTPRCTDLSTLEADIAVIGVPFGVPYDLRTAAAQSLAPAALREQSNAGRRAHRLARRAGGHPGRAQQPDAPGLRHAVDPRRRDFREVAKRAGVPRIRFHDLHHTHATLLLRFGVNPKIVQERLGHSAIGVTMDTYSHVLPGMQSEAARLVAERLLERPRSGRANALQMSGQKPSYTKAREHKHKDANTDKIRRSDIER